MEWYESYYTWYLLVFLIAIVILSTLYTCPKTVWYRNLRKPPGIPPSWVFGAVWSLLYLSILIGVEIAAWDYNQKYSFPIAALFTAIICMTCVWCISFFTFRNTILSCVILGLIILKTCIMMWLLTPNNLRLNGVSEGWCYVPVVFFSLFLLWICCAFYFNLGTAILNY